MRQILIIIGIFLFIFSFSACEHKSGRRNTKDEAPDYYRKQPNNNITSSNKKNTLRMEAEFGVKYIWVEINGLRLKFIFDTGASSICISSAEATVLYRQGTLRNEDIADIQSFQDATGNVSEGTRINLRTVKIGDRILNNIEAIVIDNNKAPLLLGQSALEKFGKISIDNNRNEIVFE